MVILVFILFFGLFFLLFLVFLILNQLKFDGKLQYKAKFLLIIFLAVLLICDLIILSKIYLLYRFIELHRLEGPQEDLLML